MMGSIREAATSYPLYWPPGWKRAAHRTRSAFGRCSMDRATQDTLIELERMGCDLRKVVISTNVELRLDGLPYSNRRAPTDTGVSIWFVQGGEERVLACDRWDLVEHNLRAIAKHVDSVRGQARWGVGSLEQAFKGYTALPAGDEPRNWRAVLCFTSDEIVYPNLIHERFKKLAMTRHPDHGGTDESFAELAMARKHALAVL